MGNIQHIYKVYSYETLKNILGRINDVILLLIVKIIKNLKRL